jgi:hypothetical protein
LRGREGVDQVVAHHPDVPGSGAVQCGLSGAGQHGEDAALVGGGLAADQPGPRVPEMSFEFELLPEPSGLVRRREEHDV